MMILFLFVIVRFYQSIVCLAVMRKLHWLEWQWLSAVQDVVQHEQNKSKTVGYEVDKVWHSSAWSLCSWYSTHISLSADHFSLIDDSSLERVNELSSSKLKRSLSVIHLSLLLAL